MIWLTCGIRKTDTYELIYQTEVVADVQNAYGNHLQLPRGKGGGINGETRIDI